MRQIFSPVFFLTVLSLAASTDLAAVYQYSVLLVRDADKATPTSPAPWENVTLQLTDDLCYPVGVTHDPKNNRLFVSDAFQCHAHIISLSLDEEHEIHTVVDGDGTAVIEGLSYDPRKDLLYWTDTTAHNIYKLPVPADLKDASPSKPKQVHDFGGVVKPRGIAVDYCNEMMYWAERGESGKVPSTIKMCDLEGTKHTIVHQSNEDVFYQDLTYDATSGQLIWAETTSDEYSKSSCRIVSSGPSGERVLVSRDQCYPFSLTTDGSYVYWADWTQEGIMRASLTDPEDVVKLVHAPDFQSEFGKHFGVFGVVALNTPDADSIDEFCKGKMKPKLQKEEPSDLKEDVKTEAKPTATTAADETLEDEADYGTTRVAYHVEAEGETTVQPDVEILGVDGEKLHFKSDHSQMSHPGAGDDDNAKPEIKEEEYIKTNSPPAVISGDSTRYFENSEQKSPADYLRAQVYSEKQLYIIVIVILAVCCALFFCTTLGLSVKILFLRRTDLPKGELPTTLPSKGTPTKRPRQPKRFGPPKKAGFTAVSTCSRQPGDDGVHINIEDCCQMTLCETPCYTTVKKEGKGYIVGKEDKKGLLDNYDF
ncbi:protein cueball-like isoform X2 [Penaeus japonicus]|uniref:protein cueball-like isoform X2 n=1 Tax=Penaeus japonicus TaxID=27405 RepID=UPI001C70B39B|nr:protein cueball-like isoform X2 [Penaeus japonicus]